MSQSSNHVKVHFSMCKELQTVIDRSLCLIPKIEAARPGSRLGIEELCSLNSSTEKAKLLIEHCSESSKMYLAITGQSYVTRCERLRNSIEKSLMHIHSMVPLELASQISDAIDSFRDVKFVMDSSDEEAGKALTLLLQKHESEDLEFQSFQTAARRLHLISSKELLVERKCIQKLLERSNGVDSKKEMILKHLLYLIEKYRKKIQSAISEYKEYTCLACIDSLLRSDPLYEGKERSYIMNNEVHRVCCSGDATLPENLKCPVSYRIMYDPVSVSPGQTFERICVEKWLREGHHICPKTRVKLPNLGVIANSSLKELRSNWCQAHCIMLQEQREQFMPEPSQYLDKSGSSTFSSINTEFVMDTSKINMTRNLICSFDSKDEHFENSGSAADAQMFAWSDDYKKHRSFSGFSNNSYMRFLSELCKFPSEDRRKAIQDLNLILSQDDGTYNTMLSNGFLASLFTYLSESYDSFNMIAWKCGTKILLVFLRYFRGDIPLPSENIRCLLACFTDSEKLDKDELMVIRALCSYSDCKHLIVASGVAHSVMKKLKAEDNNNLIFGMVAEIIYQLSSLAEMVSLILSMDYLSNLVTLLRDGQSAGCCLRIMQNVCSIDEGRRAIATAGHLLTSIVELLDDGSHGEEEQAVAVRMLLSLCSESTVSCDLIMNEGVIPPLVDISVNGSPQAIKDANSLLQLLRDHGRHHDDSEESIEMEDSTSKTTEENGVERTPVNVSSCQENPQVDITVYSCPEPMCGPKSGLPARKLNRQLARKHKDPKLTGFFGGRFFSSLMTRT